MRKEHKYLDLSLVDRKYKSFIETYVNDKYGSFLKAVNHNIGLDMYIHLNTFHINCLIDILTNNNFDESHGYGISFNIIELRNTPSKFFMSLLLEWFCEIKELPLHLCHTIHRYYNL